MLKNTLWEAEYKLFYKLWIPLVRFANEKFDIISDLQIETRQDLKPVIIWDIVKKLWENTEIIDEYLAAHPEFNEEERSIVAGWKRRIRGRFVLERHLATGTIFIALKSHEVYKVKGIVKSWEDMTYQMYTPMVMDVTFLPFRDMLISDGVVMPASVYANRGRYNRILTEDIPIKYNYYFGNIIRSEYRRIYMDAKKNKKIITSLQPE